MDNSELISEIENLLNRYDNLNPTTINPDLLKFMDRATLLSIIDSLLTQQENITTDNEQWLEKFKKHY